MGIVKYEWKILHNGTTETYEGVQVIFVFINSGVHTISLHVYDADGNHDAVVTAEELFYFARLPTTLHSITTWVALFIHPFVRPHLQHPQLFDGYPSVSNNTTELPLLPLCQKEF